MDIKQLLDQLKENNIEFVEEIWVQYTSNEYHVICKFPNGRCYNYYNALEKGAPLTGPFKSVEEATEDLLSNNPHSIKCWENSEAEETKGNLDLTYITEFWLTNPVIDLEAAQNYLLDDDMEKYAKDDYDIPKSGRNKIEKITWNLTSEQHGYISVKTNDYLTEKESEAISEWISGQCSDGLGEGFEQQDFANYVDNDEYRYNPYYVEEDEDEYEEDNWIMASFDWMNNKYELFLEE